MSSSSHTDACRVVIVGGGIAALEAVLALHDVAATEMRVTVIAPESQFTPRPVDTALEPSSADVGRLDLASFMNDHGGRFRRAAMHSIDADLRVVRCATGGDEHYDVLIVAVGASVRPAFQHALTVGASTHAHDELLTDLEQGRLQSAAFIVPDGCSWPLPLYELALLLAEDAHQTAADPQLHLVTPERAPLDMFGPQASAAVAELLEAGRMNLHLAAAAAVYRRGHVDTGSERLDVDRIVALPRLEGPRLDGVPADAHGFIPIDQHGRVLGVNDIFAAGDATDGQIKEGGLACRQADAVAGHVAALIVGAPVDPTPASPVLRGRLLAGNSDRLLRQAGQPTANGVPSLPFWWPQMEASGRYLAPYLESRGLMKLPTRTAANDDGIDVSLPLPIRTG